MLEEVIEFVNTKFNSSIHKVNPIHFERTVYWLKYLMPNADEPMLIAAYAHDIERAYSNITSEERFKDKETNDTEYLKEHQTRGAKIISEFLKKHNYDSKSIERINNMISLHEEGGDTESDLIKDADSLSYFEVVAIKHVERLVKSLGKRKTMNKLDFMYDRISSPIAKKIAEPMYNASINALENNTD